MTGCFSGYVFVFGTDPDHVGIFVFLGDNPDSVQRSTHC